MSEPKIYGLIGEAMKTMGAVGKDSVNKTQGFKYRGIDAVMNALNPVMAKLGLFVVPEVLEQTREERTTKNGVTVLYSILKMKYTIYAPDGSNVSCVVMGEGMDTGDKASNKAMAVALKYAAFQLFMIPTEEMAQDDPDKECFEVKPKNANAPAKESATVEQVKVIPADPIPPVLEFMAKEREALRVVREIDKVQNNALWNAQVKALKDAGMIPNKPLAEFTQEEATEMVTAMYKNFDPHGTSLKINDGETA